MIVKCLCCNAVKDLSVEVIYPYSNDNITQKKPVPQLFTIECQSEVGSDYRMAIMCLDCWHRLNQDRGIDMWIGEKCWQSLNPVTPFDKLPEVIIDGNKVMWNAEEYFR